MTRRSTASGATADSSLHGGQEIERREEQQMSSHDGRMRPTLYSCHGHGHGRR